MILFFDGDVGGTTLHYWEQGGYGNQAYLEVVENS